jgi:transcriptional regulator GlxA family with amidase domain
VSPSIAGGASGLIDNHRHDRANLRLRGLAMRIDVAVLAMEGISPIHLAIPCTLFGDDHGTAHPFRLMVCAAEPGELTTTVGLKIRIEHGLEAIEEAQIIVVPSWPDPLVEPSPMLIDALRRASDRGATLIGLCLGAFVLGHAGLLADREATTHWRYAHALAAKFPSVRVAPNRLYVESGGVWTSAGVAAGFDCCLEFISRLCGAQTANAMARNIVVAPHRPGGQAQFIDTPRPRTSVDHRLNAAIDAIRGQLDRAHAIDEVADRLGMTRRTFTRRFRNSVGLPFGEWLLAERVQLARKLLETSDAGMDEIARATGFGSVAAFRLQFARRAGLPPSQWRRAFRGGASPQPPGMTATPMKPCMAASHHRNTGASSRRSTLRRR